MWARFRRRAIIRRLDSNVVTSRQPAENGTHDGSRDPRVSAARGGKFRRMMKRRGRVRGARRRLRQRGDATPGLILTASGSIDEKVELLGAGADDYLVKPFEVRELIARIKVAIRRQSPSKASEVVCGDLAFDIDTRQFTLKGAPLNVTPRERSVL